MNTREIQETVISRMGYDQALQNVPVKSHVLLTKILNTNVEVIELALGKLGSKLHNFAQAVDLEHPHVGELFDEISESDAIENVLELLQLAEYGKENNLTRVISTIGNKIVCRERFCRNLLRTIDSPVNNRWRIRLLKTREQRDEVRSQKRMQIIDLSSFFKKGDEIWASQPSNFKNFIRYNTSYQEEINIAEKKAMRYLGLGCRGLYDYIQESIDTFKTQVHESYFDFNRVTMTNAAIILAKSLGCRLVSSFGTPSEEKEIFSISMPRVIFGDYCFQSGSDSYTYEPRVYPLNQLWHLASSEIKCLIDHLEVFPEAGGKAIFDNYVVLVPGPLCPVNTNLEGKFAILDKDGIHLLYDSREESYFALDCILLRDNIVPGVLLGERDGKCFFVSLFTV
jgi:hypothetical protein